MSDIVKRLRRRASTRNTGSDVSANDTESLGYYSAHDSQVDEVAAAEIERLRKDFSDASEDYHAVMSVIGTKSIADVPDMMAAKDAEIEHLRTLNAEMREALEAWRSAASHICLDDAVRMRDEALAKTEGGTDDTQ